MHFRNFALFTVIGTAALAACAKDQGSAPAVPTGVSRSVSTVSSVAPSCNFTTMRNDAALYFVMPNSVTEKITQMENAYTSGGAAGATDKGFDVLSRVSSALTTAGALGGSPTAGDTFVKDVLACMSVGTLPGGFSVVGALSPNGMFNVVGGPSDPSGPMTSRGSPIYGAEPQAGQTWLSSGGQRFLLYGYERDFSFTPETPAAVTAFELATVPTPITFAPPIAGGICQTTATNSLLQSVNVILPLQTLSFCSGVTSVRANDGVFASLTHAASSLFSPREAFAFGVGGTGSLLSGLSPKGAVTFAPAAAGLTFVQPPFDSKRSLRPPQFVPPISVRVTTANGTPVNGVVVTLNVLNNKGSYQSFNNTATSGSGGAGIAVFPNFYIDKAGGYIINATATIFGTPTKSVTSNLFNISGL